MLTRKGLYIIETADKGRGVFTVEEIREGDIIEICPVILIPELDVPKVHLTHLHDYYFLWPDDKGSACIALGYGSLYNHSETPNAVVAFDLESLELEIHCTRNIMEGEEVFIDYTDGEGKGLWF